MPQSRSPGPQSPSSITAAATAAVAAAHQQARAAAAVGNNSNINPALGTAGEDAASQLSGLGHMDSAQILALLRHLPGVFNKLTDGTLKEGTAAQLQEHLAGATGAGPVGPLPMMNDPNDHPYPDDPNDGDYTLEQPNLSESPQATGRSRRRMFSKQENEDWMRMRKENHKEVERRRRGNINEGINALASIIPNESGESKAQAKGAILSRAAQYIQHLKDNEARNIEKWTLEKLLMDQAMGDLQAQLEEMRKMWEDEHTAKAALENEVVRLQNEMQAMRSKEDGEGPRKRARVD